MNKLVLQNKRDFALTTDALAFMQDAYEAFEKFGYLGGDNYIVSGCLVTGSSVAAGYMFLKGKLMPFVGGTITTNVQIIPTTSTITVDNGTRDQTSYRAEFGTSATPENNILWSDINNGLVTGNDGNITWFYDLFNKTVQVRIPLHYNLSQGESAVVGVLPPSMRPASTLYFLTCGDNGIARRTLVAVTVTTIGEVLICPQDSALISTLGVRSYISWVNIWS